MRIVLSYGLLGRGGDAVQVQSMAEALEQLGHDVTLVGAASIIPYEFGTSAAHLRRMLRRLPWWVKDALGLALRVRVNRSLRRALKPGAPDLVIHRAGMYDVTGTRLAKICPVIAHLDAPFAVERAYRGERYLKSRHERAMCSLGESSRLILTPSEAAKAHYEGMGIPAEKIVVMPNGVSREQLALGQEWSRRHPPLSPKGHCTLGFVGSLSRWHGVDLLLMALQLLNRERAGSFRLRVVGRGEEFDRLRELTRTLGLGEQVDWLGAVPQQQAFEEIASFDIAVLPHTLSTGAPMKLFEYAAMARPMIAPDLLNLRALFSADESRFFTPESPKALADVVLDLVANPERARELGLRAQKRAEGYSWESILENVLRLAGAGESRGADRAREAGNRSSTPRQT